MADYKYQSNLNITVCIRSYHNPTILIYYNATNKEQPSNLLQPLRQWWTPLRLLLPFQQYLPTAPALQCSQCTHFVESGVDSPYNITHYIVTCDEHSTTAPPPSTSTSSGASAANLTSGASTSAAAAATSPLPAPSSRRPSPSASNSLHVGRRMRGVNPGFYKKIYAEVCTLISNGASLYDALKILNISRGSWRPIRLLAEALILHEESFLDRLTMDNVENQKDALNIAKELLSLPNTRVDLLNLYQEDRTKVPHPESFRFPPRCVFF